MLTVKNTWETTAKAGMLFLAMCYVIWVPVCVFVVLSLVVNPKIWLLYIWMMFGVVGLLAIPHAFMQWFVITEFSESESEYIIVEKSRFGRRRHVIPKDQFEGFAYREDEDGGETDYLSINYRRNGKTERVYILYWMKKECKDSVIRQLGWI